MINDVTISPGFIDPEISFDTDVVEVIVKFNGSLALLEEEMDVQIENLGMGYAIITLRANQIRGLYDYPQIEFIEVPKIVTFSLRESLIRSCVTQVQSPQGYGLTGQGVLIAIIDSGIDYTHPDFRNPDGTTRILFLWDQSGSGNPPPGFSAGTEYNAAQLNEALQSAQPLLVIPQMDTVGHGTSVSGPAAGNGRASNGLNKGVAPEASLLVVRLGQRGLESFSRTTEIMRAVKYVYDKALILGMPLAVNLSFGTNNGAHDGQSLFEGYINAISTTWKSVFVVASGNEGVAGHHFSAKIAQNEAINVDFVISSFTPSVYMAMWKNFVDDLSLELIAPGGRSSGIIRPGGAPVTRFRSPEVAITIYYGQPTVYNDDQEVFFYFQALDGVIPSGLYRLIVRGERVVDGRFNLWLPTVEEVTTNTAFFNPTVETTLTLPSTALNVLTVGAYDARQGSAADFSGRGYTRNNVYVKPDLVAPGVAVITTWVGGQYGTSSGTSIAAPFVTGSAALMMEWGIIQGNDPFLYGQRAKAFLQKGAGRFPGQTYPNPIWGYGTLCLKNTMDELFIRR